MAVDLQTRAMLSQAFDTEAHVAGFECEVAYHWFVFCLLQKHNFGKKKEVFLWTGPCFLNEFAVLFYFSSKAPLTGKRVHSLLFLSFY